MSLTHQLIEGHQEQLTALQSRISYSFSKLPLLFNALCHRSFTTEGINHSLADNETLEFLGDAVLDLSISALLISMFPTMNEGELSKLRAALVNEPHLAKVAKDLELNTCLFLGKGEQKSGGSQKSSILSSTYEALLGAIFLDAGYPPTNDLIIKHFQKRIIPMQKSVGQADSKSLLQELIQQKHNVTPVYALENSEGPDHDKSFTVSVSFQGQTLATASAKNKKAAEQKAAQKALSLFSA